MPARCGSRPSTSAWSTRRGVRLLDDISFELRAGEIVGIAGVVRQRPDRTAGGAGRHPAADRAARSRSCGRTIDADHPGDPAEMRDLGLAHVPEDRLRLGLVAAFRASETAILGYHEQPPFSRNYLLNGAGGRRPLRQADGALRRPPARARPAIVEFLRRQPAEARAGARDGARAQGAAGRPADARRRHRRHRVHPRELVRSRDAGSAVLLVSVELDEILALADRILVMFAGRIIGEVDGRPRRRAHARPADGGSESAPALSGAEGLRAPRRPLPAGPTSSLLPLVNVALAFLISASSCASIGDDPLAGARAAGRRRAAARRRRSATRSTTPPTSSSPASRWRSPSMAGCSTSAARARPISAAWAAGSRCWRSTATCRAGC